MTRPRDPDSSSRDASSSEAPSAARAPSHEGVNSAPRSPTPEDDPPGSPRTWVLWTCLVGCFATTFTMTILGVSLRAIASDLGSDVSTIAWVVTAPMLAAAVSAPLLGKMGDLHGHRRVYLIGFVIATVAAFATAYAWDATSLIGLRTLGQLAGTATMPASMAILFRVYQGRERVKAMGWMSVVIAGAPVLGLAVGGVLIEAIGWRTIFLIQGVLSAVACAVAQRVLDETPRRADLRLDVPGAALLAAASFALTFTINRLPNWGLTDPRVVPSFIIMPLLFYAFVLVERRAEHPLLPLEFLRERNFVCPLAVGFALQFAYMGGFIISPLIMMGLFGLGQAATSLWTIARPISLSAASPVGGQLGSKYGERAMIFSGSVMIFAAMASFAAGAEYALLPFIILGLILAGVGMGLAQPSLTTIVASAVPSDDHGVAVSTMSTMTGIGAVAGVSILTALCADVETAESFRDGYALGAAVAVLGILASLGIKPIDHDEPQHQPASATPATSLGSSS